jgi:hypothetical protein
MNITIKPLTPELADDYFDFLKTGRLRTIPRIGVIARSLK